MSDKIVAHTTEAGGNVFADLGFEPAEADVMTGKASKFTIDALVDMLQKLGKAVRLQVA